MKKYKIAVLDDYQNAEVESADWSVLRDRADISVFQDHLADPDALDWLFSSMPFDGRAGCRAGGVGRGERQEPDHDLCHSRPWRPFVWHRSGPKPFSQRESDGNARCPRDGGRCNLLKKSRLDGSGGRSWPVSGRRTGVGHRSIARRNYRVRHQPGAGSGSAHCAFLVAAGQESGLRVELRGGPDCGSAPWSCLGGDLRSSRALLVILDADISKHPIRRRSWAREYRIQKRLTYVHL
jgi:hypothetical protein